MEHPVLYGGSPLCSEYQLVNFNMVTGSVSPCHPAWQYHKYLEIILTLRWKETTITHKQMCTKIIFSAVMMLWMNDMVKLLKYYNFQLTIKGERNIKACLGSLLELSKPLSCCSRGQIVCMWGQPQWGCWTRVEGKVGGGQRMGWR